MNSSTIHALLISDFNITPLANFLNNSNDPPSLITKAAPYGQIQQILLDHTSSFLSEKSDLVVVWTQPEKVIESFHLLADFRSVSLDRLLLEVDEYSELLMKIKHRVKWVFVPTWTFPLAQTGSILTEMNDGNGITNTLFQMNLRLARNFSNIANFYLLNTNRWVEFVGRNAYNQKLWYMAKIPYSSEVFKHASKDMKTALRGILGWGKKLIILDLDDTLWGGTVGDLGWQNIQLGGHDPMGEAFVDFQKALKSLKNRGILLAVISKNQESIALEAICSHSEMVLRTEDFAGWKINWHDKAENILDLVSDLNIGLESVVFIDDNAFERARVREALPDVLVPEWPESPMLYKSALLSLPYFDSPSITAEDLSRAEMYAAERRRKQAQKSFVSLEAWLKGLNLTLEVEELSERNLIRTTQLLNKTNQMNLTTRRLAEKELLEWSRQPNCTVWTCRVTDKFGDLGLTGIVSLCIDGAIGTIVDFVLSCRVMGRRIEETLLYIIINYARSLNLHTIHAKYRPTAKNKPCLEFWKRSGFKYSETEDLFTWDLRYQYLRPDHVLIKMENQTTAMPLCN